MRGRIESVLDWATARGYRTGDNPARWRGHMDNLLRGVKARGVTDDELEVEGSRLKGIFYNRSPAPYGTRACRRATKRQKR